ncbi:MAG: hypothetical protein AB1801_11690 [Chloroflexota bacterium]
MKNLNLVLKSGLGIVLVVLLLGVWAGPAAAAPPDQQSYPRLEYGLKLAQIRVDALQDIIDTANRTADLAEEFIQDEQAAGHDTSALEAALTELRAKIDEAQTLRDEAAQILDEKAGFDEDGKVVDPQQARDTLENAHRKMQDATQTLRIARQDFRQAMRDYRQSRRDSDS